ncbi:MAG: hypothetical protein Cons2KO_33380 [Congregibacter sp.]
MPAVSPTSNPGERNGNKLLNAAGPSIDLDDRFGSLALAGSIDSVSSAWTGPSNGDKDCV